MFNNSSVTSEQAEKIFEQVIVPLIMNGVVKEEKKTAYIVGGQPGSGKSALAQSLLSKNRNIVFINGDDLRVYHPAYVPYLKENDQEVADRTQELCNFWIEKSIAECIKNSLSFIVEGTMRTTKAPLLTASKAAESGYEVYGCVISAPYELSLASINYRYTETKRIEGYARFTKKESHDEAYKNLPETMKSLLNQNVFSGVTVYKRLDGSFTGESFSPQKAEEIFNTIREGRERLLTEREMSFIKENQSPDGHTFPIV
jgi:UDP-N-acetylglucosamine kinase